MKLNQIEIKITKRTGAYESATFGGVWSVAEDEQVEEQNAFAQCYEAVTKAYTTATAAPTPAPTPTPTAAPTPAPTPTPTATPTPTPTAKKQLTIDSPELSAITKRIADGVPVAKVLEYYEADDKAMAILRLAEGE